MSTTIRPARSIYPKLDALEERLVLSRLDAAVALTGQLDLPQGLHHGDRSIRMIDVPDTLAAAKQTGHTVAPQSQAGGAVGGGAPPIMGGISAQVVKASNHVSGHAVADNSSSGSSAYYTFSSSANITGSTSSSVSGGVSAGAGFNSGSGQTISTASLNGLSSSSGQSSGAVVVAGYGGFMGAGQAAPTAAPFPAPQTSGQTAQGLAAAQAPSALLSQPGAGLTGPTPQGLAAVQAPSAVLWQPGTTLIPPKDRLVPADDGEPGEAAAIANYNAMGTKLVSLRNTATQAAQAAEALRTQRNVAVSKLFTDSGGLISFSDIEFNFNNLKDPHKVEWEIKGELRVKLKPAQVDKVEADLQAIAEIQRPLLEADLNWAKAKAAAIAQRAAVAAQYWFLLGKYAGHIHTIKPPWRL